MTTKAQEFSACTSILVGKNASKTGSVMIGRNEDCKAAWPKHTKIFPRSESQSNPTFKSKANGFEIMLPKIAQKYTANPEWTDKYGVFAEAGINESGVAMSATESAYANEEVLACDPLVADGISEEAMVTVVLPYISSAKDGVLRLGNIVETKGASEINGILFADQNEAWYMEIGSGHMWVAQRIPDDGYAVVANQLAIQTVDLADESNFLASPNIAEFITTNQLNPAKQPEPTKFNFREIFGTHTSSDLVYSTPRVWDGQRRLTPSLLNDASFTPQSDNLSFIQYPDKKLSRSDIFGVLKSHYNDTKYDPLKPSSPDAKRFRPISLAKTQESHVLELRPNIKPSECGIHWLALGVSAQSLFVPIFAGANDVDARYKRGRQTYSADSAYWQYKLLGVLVDPHYAKFGTLLDAFQTEQTTKLFALANQTIKYLVDHNAEDNQAYLTAQTKKAQAQSLAAVSQFCSQLITQATDLSPLNFFHDANL